MGFLVVKLFRGIRSRSIQTNGRGKSSRQAGAQRHPGRWALYPIGSNFFNYNPPQTKIDYPRGVARPMSGPTPRGASE